MDWARQGMTVRATGGILRYWRPQKLWSLSSERHFTIMSARKAKTPLKGQGWSSTQEIEARRKIAAGKPEMWCPSGEQAKGQTQGSGGARQSKGRTEGA